MNVKLQQKRCMEEDYESVTMGSRWCSRNPRSAIAKSCVAGRRARLSVRKLTSKRRDSLFIWWQSE